MVRTVISSDIFFNLVAILTEIFSRCSIYDLAFKPDGSQLIVAAGNRVLVIN